MVKQRNNIIITLVIWVIILMLIINVKNTNVYAQEVSLTLSTDKTEYNVGDDVIIKAKFSEKMMTVSYYINYDNQQLKFKSVKTQNVTAKDYETDGTLRVIYFDMSGQGTDEMEFIFTAKASTTKITYNVSNLTASTSEGNKTIKQSDITINENNNVSIIEKNENKTEENKNTTNPVEDNKNNNTRNPQEDNKNTTKQAEDDKNKDTKNNINSNSSENSNNNKNTTNNIQKMNNTTKTNSTNNVNLKNKTTDNFSYTKTNNINTSSKDQSTSSKPIPQTGTNDTLLYLIVAFVGVNIYLLISLIKFRQYFK